MSEIKVRRATTDDAVAVHGCLDSVARERRFLAIVEAPSVEDVASFIGQPGVAQVVAMDGNDLVGWADVRRMKTPGLRHRGAVGMGVIDGHRRRGIGSLLLSAVIDAARALDVQRLELQVFRSNLVALRLYEAHGFVVEGEQPGARLLDGIADDIVFMCRWLSASTSHDETKPEIRSATMEDLAAINELVDGLDEVHRIGAPWLFAEPASPPRPPGYFDEYFRGDTHTALVAASNGGVVGVSLALLRATPEFPIFRRERFGVLDGLGVAPSFRRRGVGAHLVRATEEWARSKGAAWLEVGVHEFNEDARRFYERLGFETTFRKLRKPFHTG